MTSAFASLFNKKIGCPSSQRLVDYNESRLAANQMASVENHLGNCDFCNAELQLLTRHFSHGDECSFGEMPAQLRRLAERWLKNGVAALSGLPQIKKNQRA
jgi:hypothetical protein